jgi:hypothetical protein
MARDQLLNRRSALALLAGAGLGGLTAGQARASPPGLAVSGRVQQSGFVIGATEPGARVLLDGVSVGRASPSGLFFTGFDRDAPATCVISVETDDGGATHQLAVAPGDYDIQRIDGLPQNQVTPTSPALLARIRAEAGRKAVGFASAIDADHFRNGFVMPVKATRVSGRFGGQRILNGVPGRPHYGIDLAAPEGAEIIAPADGLVSFAETGLHFEGGLVMIDHGQGLITLYLHMSKVDVTAGQKVSRGARIGAVGMEGRATGPHLCWRMKWRDRNLDPSLMVGAAAPRVS